MTSPRAEALLRSPIGLELFYLIEWRRETSLTADELMARASEARRSATVYRGDYVEHVRFLRSQAPRYEDQAENVAARMERWWAPLDRTAQVWAAQSSVWPMMSELVTDLSQLHPEAPKPKAAMWTSTFVPRTISPWLDWPENINRREPYKTWRLAVSDTARVAEVHSPEDWWELAHAYPASPWQRGSNENTNGLLRQYFPKGTDLSVHSAEHLAFVADEMNQRPRKTLDWLEPREALAQLFSESLRQPAVASTD